jgi:hypothetical protein
MLEDAIEEFSNRDYETSRLNTGRSEAFAPCVLHASPDKNWTGSASKFYDTLLPC